MPSLTKREPARKPYPTFPLGVHPTGRWCKRIRGTLYYFGSTISDPEGKAAKALYDAEAEYLYRGEVPPTRQPVEPEPDPDTFTIKDACDVFLDFKEERMKNGRISRRHFADLKSTCVLLADCLGRAKPVSELKPADFKGLAATLAKRFGLIAQKNAIVRVRSVFKFALANDHIAKPVRYGSMFDAPSEGELQKQRNEKPERLFEAADLRKIIDAASQPLRAAVLLGVNAGLGNTDVSRLEFRHLDLTGGWLNFPRPKTGVARRCKLWVQTVATIREAIAKRPTPKSAEHGELVFLTRCGQPWVKLNASGTPADALGQEFKKLLVEQSLWREGLGFYTLRHCTETFGGNCKDQIAMNGVMGHKDRTMAAHYRERIEDTRLEAVAATIRDWLYPPEAKPASKPRATRAARKPREQAQQRPTLRVVG